MADRRCAVAALVLAVASAAPARAGGKLDDATAQAFGGTYAVDCKKPSGVRLHVAADTLAVEAGGKRVESHDVQRAVTYAGTSQPADYLGTLLGDVPGGEPLVFQAYRDARGLYIVVDADVGLQAKFGKTTLAAKFHSCEAQAQRGAAPPPAKPPAPARGAPSK
jgi:hypothetical protein